MPRKGWLQRQSEKTTKDINTWPSWMRRAAGVEKQVEEGEQKREATRKGRETNTTR